MIRFLKYPWHIYIYIYSFFIFYWFLYYFWVIFFFTDCYKIKNFIYIFTGCTNLQSIFCFFSLPTTDNSILFFFLPKSLTKVWALSNCSMTHSSYELIFIDFKNSLKIIPITNETLFMTKMHHQTKNKKNTKVWNTRSVPSNQRQKQNFPLDTSCRTINSSKTLLGIISRTILQKYIAIIRNKSKLRK